MAAPVVLDFDGSVGAIAGAVRIDLSAWQDAIRFGCSLQRLSAAMRSIGERLPSAYGSVFLGSGDYHHLTWPLVERQCSRGPFDVVVFDNHPDNMRFPFGVHCGSWVRRVALLPFVSHVHVLGIGSGDVSGTHAWENYLTPLRRRKLTYWTVGVDTRWAARAGLAHAFRAFESPDALVARFRAEQAISRERVYLSIDKDVFDASVARTNWDQGHLLEAHADALIDALHGRIIGSDITGDVSSWRYASWWKRRLSALDRQPAIDPAQLAVWQSQQHALNLRLLERIAAASA